MRYSRRRAYEASPKIVHSHFIIAADFEFYYGAIFLRNDLGAIFLVPAIRNFPAYARTEFE